MENKLSKQIQNAGLSEKEALIYAALVELGGAFPSKIAEITKLKRTTVYKVLLDLTIKGLVNEIEKKNKLYYQVDKPEKLMRYAKDKVRIAEDQMDKAKKLIPELEGLFNLTTNKPRVLYFEGPDAVYDICMDMISGNEKYEMLAFSNAEKFQNYLPTGKLREFIKGKERIGITTRAIIPDTKAARGYNEAVFAGTSKNIWPVIKFVSKEIFPYEAELTIYGKNKVSITKLGKENVIGVIIEDEIIHGMMKMIFGLAWKTATE